MRTGRSSWRALGRAAALTALWAAGACSLLEPEFLAEPAGTERPVRVEVRLEGNDHISRLRILRAIEDEMLDLSRKPDRDAAAYDARLKIEDLYRENGYPDVAIDHAIDRSRAAGENPRLLVTFRIREGARVTVDEPRIEGNRAFSDHELLDLWERTNSGALGFGEPLFVLADLEQFALDLRVHYRNHGYVEARVEGPLVQREPGGRRAHVSYRVHEGPCYHIAGVEVDLALLEALGEDAPSEPVGEPYTRQAIQDYVLALRGRLRARGHPEPRVEWRVRKVAGEPRVVLSVEGEPGRTARIAEVLVRGNERTWTSVVRARVPLHPGDRFDGRAVQEGLRNLYLTGLFRKVRIIHEWVDDDRVRLVVEVEELPSRTLELLVGYGSYEMVRGMVRFEEANLFGTGRALQLEQRASLKGFRSTATLTDPHTLGVDTVVGLQAEFFRREEPSFTDQAAGATLAITHDLDDLVRDLSARVGYSYRQRAGAESLVVTPGNERVDFVEGRVFTELHLDRRDSILFPREGHHERLTLDFMNSALGADVSFFRLRAGAAAYLRIPEALGLPERSRLVLRADAGWLWPKEDSSEVPIQERFFNGGESTVRSFRESRLGPVDARGNPVGGEFRHVFGAELRVPLLREILEGAAFADAGNVGRDITDYGFDDFRFGVGAGLRVLLPIGPVRVDASWNPDRRLGEREWTIHFSVGYPF